MTFSVPYLRETKTLRIFMVHMQKIAQNNDRKIIESKEEYINLLFIFWDLEINCD